MMVMAVGPPPPVPSAPDRQTTPQAMGSDAAEGVGGAFPVVGIGMSAGGLEVATAFPNAMPVVQIEVGMEIGAAVSVSRPPPGASRLSSLLRFRVQLLLNPCPSARPGVARARRLRTRKPEGSPRGAPSSGRRGDAGLRVWMPCPREGRHP